jgi:uncharacterized protein DUF6459
MQDSTVPPPSVPASPTYPDPVPLIPRTRSGRRPLPDAQAICRFTVPEFAPPYDDAAARRTASGRRLAIVAASGDDLPNAGDSRRQPARPRAIRPAQTARTTQRPADEHRPPQTNAWPSRFAQVLAETLAGSRPASQIVPWTTQQTRQRISQLGPVLGASHRPRVRRLMVTSPAGGVLEMTVIVAVGDHVRAVAVRLERARPGLGQGRSAAPAHGRYRRSQSDWLCTAIEAA